jgi:hypothetical protein
MELVRSSVMGDNLRVLIALACSLGVLASPWRLAGTSMAAVMPAIEDEPPDGPQRDVDR